MQGWHCPLVLSADSRLSPPSCFVSFCFVACTFLFPLPCATAGVAVHSTPVATTEQLVQGRGSWEEEDGRSRTLQRESAEKQVAE